MKSKQAEERWTNGYSHFPTDVNDKMQSIYNFFKPDAERNGLKFTCENGLPSDEAIIQTDTDKILVPESFNR